MVSSAAKRKIKAKDDKMLTLERYFESCGRDLSRTLSWTKWYGLYQNWLLLLLLMPENVTFPKLWQPPSKKKIWQTTDLQTATPAKHFLEQSRTKETWKWKPNRKENRVKKLKEGPCAHQKCINQLQRWCNPLNEPIWQKGQLWRPPKRGHVSCRKSVSHERTSTVSSPLSIIPPSLSMRNITLLSPSFLSLVHGPLSPLTSALTSRSWNAIW